MYFPRRGRSELRAPGRTGQFYGLDDKSLSFSVSMFRTEYLQSRKELIGLSLKARSDFLRSQRPVDFDGASEELTTCLSAVSLRRDSLVKSK